MHRRRALAAAVAFVAAALVAAARAQAQPAATRNPAHDIACGPRATLAPPQAAMAVAGAASGRTLFGPGDIVAIGAGSAHGLVAGAEFFTRRHLVDRFDGDSRAGVRHSTIHTTGWVRVVEVGPDRATATVVHACDTIEAGDYLEPFALPEAPASVAPGQPDFAHPARVLLGDERRQMGSAGSFMVLDRGRDQGVTSGQRLTVFRASFAAGPVERVAEATVVAVAEGSATIRIDSSRDAVYVGDLVAVHR